MNNNNNNNKNNNNNNNVMDEIGVDTPYDVSEMVLLLF